MKAITNLFEESVDKYKNSILLWEKTTDKYEGTTYGEVKKQVNRFAAGLMKMGLNKGDRVALISEGRNDWIIAELGILYAGGINIPLSIKLNDPSEIAFRVNHSGARMIIASHGQVKKVRQIKSLSEHIEKMIWLDAEDVYEDLEVPYQEILKHGDEYLSTHNTDFEARWKSVKESDYANICYTSGTTADPKGIILTHRNYTANSEQALTLMDIPEWFISLIILPWDHAFAHTACLYTLIKSGASIASVQAGKSPSDGLKNIPINIKEIKPSFLLSVPALAKNFKKNIEGAIRTKGIVTEMLFRQGLKIAYKYNGYGWDRGKGLRILLKPLYRIYDKLIFSKIRENFGGKLEFFIGGGAMLDIELQHFFYAIGIPMYQGYGLTEASPIISSNSGHRHKLGSSGHLVENLDLKICDNDGNERSIGEKGEIVIRGENVMAGYWENPKATEESIRNGWFYTGDMGYMDKDGFLYVLGRFKSLLISDDGEKYSPEGMEEAFVSQSKYIDQCMLYNNQSPYTILLMVPNKEGLRRWLKEHHHLDPATEEGQKAVLKLLQSEINEYRTGQKYGNMFPQRWIPSAIGVLDESFTEENHLMNSTMKMVRPKVIERYKERIEYLYNPEAKDVCNTTNQLAIQKIMK
jgi:long-chain acyl-CoA synthetase